MRPIQVVLVLGLLASLGIYRYAFRSALGSRILVLGILLAAFIAVLFPNYTQDLAEYLGVGRGVDLLMYFYFVAAIFFAILFLSKVARIERRQTDIVRALALWTAYTAERKSSRSVENSSVITTADSAEQGPAEP